jgi:hypothetical protein
MEYFLRQLARKKNEFYMKTQQSNPPYRKEDCLHRVLDLEKYETVLEVINMLGPQESILFQEIEKRDFPDAPYVR